MFKRLKLIRFKNFEASELSPGPLTVLMGANASGKSNVRDAFRILHGIGRGYTLAEIFGGKWVGGASQWDGIRRGASRMGYRGAETFALQVEAEYGDAATTMPEAEHDRVSIPRPEALGYHIEIKTPQLGPPRVRRESYHREMHITFHAYPDAEYCRSAFEARLVEAEGQGKIEAHVLTSTGTPESWTTETFSADQPVLSQVISLEDVSLVEQPSTSYVKWTVEHDLRLFQGLRFIDLAPDAMRNPSQPGHTELSDRGENLSAVLQSICAQPGKRAELIQWSRALTPMDVTDLRFLPDPRGLVLLALVETDGSMTLADSASDGTLRFLGLLAALFSDKGGLLFLEEIENGLHPSRLRLLVDLLKARTGTGLVQVVATTHSPTLLSLLDDELLQHVSLIYRTETDPAGHIVRLLDIPDAKRVLGTHDRADLLATGWFEDVLEFAAAPREPLKQAPASQG